MKKRCFLHIFGFIFEDILSLDLSLISALTDFLLRPMGLKSASSCSKIIIYHRFHVQIIIKKDQKIAYFYDFLSIYFA